MSSIIPVKMPKWGLSMQEGKVVHWWKAPGEQVNEGDDLLDIETSKITNTAESTHAGILRRVVADVDQTAAVGALLAVIADEAISEEEIDSFVDDWRTNFVPEAEDAVREQQLELRMIEAGGRVLRVGVTRGDGAPIVLLHGFGADLNNWLFNIDALSAAGPVMAIDLPGHGTSSKDIGDGSLRTLAASIAAVFSQAGIDRVHLVGHSLGAAVAAQLALDRPGLALSLVLIAPAGLPGSVLSESFLNGFVAAERRQKLKPVLEKLVADRGLVSRGMVEDVLKFKRLDGAQEALAVLRDRMIEGGDFRLLQSHLAELPPSLVIAGRRDEIVTGSFESNLPAGWRVAWIEGAGHMPHVERSGEVNRLILSAMKA